jgi:hypothetical protein
VSLNVLNIYFQYFYFPQWQGIQSTTIVLRMRQISRTASCDWLVRKSGSCYAVRCSKSYYSHLQNNQANSEKDNTSRTTILQLPMRHHFPCSPLQCIEIQIALLCFYVVTGLVFCKWLITIGVNVLTKADAIWWKGFGGDLNIAAPRSENPRFTLRWSITTRMRYMKDKDFCDALIRVADAVSHS